MKRPNKSGYFWVRYGPGQRWEPAYVLRLPLVPKVKGRRMTHVRISPTGGSKYEIELDDYPKIEFVPLVEPSDEL